MLKAGSSDLELEKLGKDLLKRFILCTEFI